MDDIVIIHEDKAFLRKCVQQMYEYAERERGLTFNEKTQIFPLKNGVEYLGFRFALSDTGAVVRRVKTSSKLRYKRRLRRYQALYREGRIEAADVRQSLAGFHGHLKHGDTYWMRRRALGKFALSRGDTRKVRLCEPTWVEKRTIEYCIMI